MNNKFNQKNIILLRLGILFFVTLIFIVVLQIPRVYAMFVKKNELNLHIFADVIAPEVFYEFEQKTGIKVNVNYFVLDEELLAKLRIDRGEGTDLVMVSDRNAEAMIKKGLLHKIDFSKISNFEKADKRLLDMFSPEVRAYVLQFAWTPVGIGYSKKFFGGDLSNCSWRMIFNPSWNFESCEEPVIMAADMRTAQLQTQSRIKNELDWITHPKKYKVCMFDCSLDCFLLAALYLYNTITDFTSDERDAIKNLLIQQKQWVEIYTNANIEYYLQADIAPALVTNSALMKSLVAKKYDEFGFVVPREGSLVTVLSFAIPATSEKQEKVHQLMDFLWSKKIALSNFDQYGYNPINSLAYSEIEERFLKDLSFFPIDEAFKKLYVASNKFISVKDLADLWVTIKSE